jgi:hypothetical protein
MNDCMLRQPLLASLPAVVGPWALIQGSCWQSDCTRWLAMGTEGVAGGWTGHNSWQCTGEVGAWLGDCCLLQLLLLAYLHGGLTSSNNNVGESKLDLLSAEHHGFGSRRTHLVHRCCRSRQRHTGGQRCLPCRCCSNVGRQHVAHVHGVDCSWRYTTCGE